MSILILISIIVYFLSGMACADIFHRQGIRPSFFFGSIPDAPRSQYDLRDLPFQSVDVELDILVERFL